MYNNRLIPELLHHIFTTWRCTAPSKGIEAMTNINKPINPTLPLMQLWKNMDNTQKICIPAGALMTAPKILNTLHTLLTLTVKYKDDLCTWDSQPALYKTYGNMHMDFNKAYGKQEKEASLQRSGFGAPSMAANIEAIAANTAHAMESLQATCTAKLEQNKKHPTGISCPIATK